MLAETKLLVNAVNNQLGVISCSGWETVWQLIYSSRSGILPSIDNAAAAEVLIVSWTLAAMLTAGTKGVRSIYSYSTEQSQCVNISLLVYQQILIGLVYTI